MAFRLWKLRCGAPNGSRPLYCIPSFSPWHRLTASTNWNLKLSEVRSSQARAGNCSEQYEQKKELVRPALEKCKADGISPRKRYPQKNDADRFRQDLHNGAIPHSPRPHACQGQIIPSEKSKNNHPHLDRRRVFPHFRSAHPLDLPPLFLVFAPPLESTPITNLLTATENAGEPAAAAVGEVMAKSPAFAVPEALKLMGDMSIASFYREVNAEVD